MGATEASEIEQSRRLFRDLLVLISDPGAQLDYEQRVPIANVPAELVCMWFDDHYHPDMEWFEDTFTERERQVLSRFNGFYDVRVGDLPSAGGVGALHRSQSWGEVVTAARQALDELGWEVA